MSLSAQSDRDLLNAYLREDMSVWQAYVDTVHHTPYTLHYEYGYCGFIVSKDKEAAKPYVQRFKSEILNLKSKMPPGHYEMYMSAVYVFELRLHESIHPMKAMSLAKDAVKLAPNDPVVLSYYGTCLFYAPKPFGSKEEALTWFLRAAKAFDNAEWYDCWWRPATMMYIAQCYDKTGDTAQALRTAQQLIEQYPNYEYIKRDYIPDLIRRTE